MNETNARPSGFCPKSVAAYAVAAMLASTILLGNGLIFGGGHPAYAKEKSCRDKRKDCEARCRSRYYEDWPKITACYKRTCDKQHNNCTNAVNVPSQHAPPENATKNWGDGVRPTGGNKPLPSKPKIMGQRAPLSGVNKSPGPAVGGPILRSSGGVGKFPGGRSGGGRK
jgi:hypothetical protein